MAQPPIVERNQDATVYAGGLDEKVTEEILWELFLQAGPVQSISMPKDRITNQHQGFGFVEFLSEEDADYAIRILNMIKLYGKPIRANKASAHQKNLDIGANIFVGNLDPEVDEKLLYDTFSAFGVILQIPKIMRDVETGNSKGFAFINFASFEAADAGVDSMNGQYLQNRPLQVSYAYKKDGKGERHGTAAERLLAAKNPLTQHDRPHQIFAEAPIAGVPPPPGLAGLPGVMPAVRMPPASVPPPPGMPHFPQPTPSPLPPPPPPGMSGSSTPVPPSLPPGFAQQGGMPPRGIPGPPPGQWPGGVSPYGNAPPSIPPPPGMVGMPMQQQWGIRPQH